MRTTDRKGQGATEYLLMLAAVLVIVAAAIYYILSATPGGVAPTVNVDLADHPDADKVKMEVTKVSETVKQADWQYCVWWDNEDQPAWDDAPEDLKVKTYNLTISGTHTGPGTYDVWLYHKPTKSVMFKGKAKK